jgi:hypothetical protein
MKKQGIAFGIILSMAATAVNAAEVDSAVGNNDFKRYSAAGCGATTHAKAQVTKAGSVFNTGTGANTITCPVIIDRGGFDTDYYAMNVLRASGAGTMTCYLSTQTGASVTTTNVTVATTGTDTYVGFTGGFANSASLGCVVPAKVAGGSSGIKWYETNEY